MSRLKSNLSYKQKRLICQYSVQNPTLQQKEIGEWARRRFSLPYRPCQGTISRMLKKKDIYLNDHEGMIGNRRKTRAGGKSDQLDQQLANWVKQCASRGILLTDDLIKNKGRLLADSLNIINLAFSNGWLYCFKKRHGIKLRKLNNGSAFPILSPVEDNPEFAQIISRYELQDIYNMDETGLFYQITPDQAHFLKLDDKERKGKTKLTIALTVNADGTDKLLPLVIGCSQKPRCFRKKSAEQFGFKYRSNAKAWMTTSIFTEWLMEINDHFKRQNRHALLIVDNSPSHKYDETLLSHVKILILSSNAPAKYQPMECGIMTNFRKHYRCLQVTNALERDKDGDVDIYKVDQLSAMKWIKDAWDEVNPEVIAESFRNSNILSVGYFSSVQKLPEIKDNDFNFLLPNVSFRETLDMSSHITHPAENQGMHYDGIKGEFISHSKINEDSVEQSIFSSSAITNHPTVLLQSIKIVIDHLNLTDPEQAYLLPGLRKMQEQIQENNVSLEALKPISATSILSDIKEMLTKCNL